MKVIVGQPIYGSVPGEAAISFTQLITHETMAGRVAGVVQSMTNPLGRARNSIVRHALTVSATHVLFVDCDMIVPRSGLSRLLARDLPVVGALYFQREAPHYPVVAARPGKPPEMFCPLLDYTPGLNKVFVTGFGFVLVQMSVFTRMAEHFGDEKWFDFGAGDSEDLWFGERCRQMGIPVWLDADVECGHVASIIVDSGHYKRKEI